MITRTQLLVRGIVQGVGFRPYVFSLARRRALRGRVLNNTTGVLIDLEGDCATVEQFITEIALNPPPLALVESVERSDNLDPQHYPDFQIIESKSNGEKFVPISSDIATCNECLKELFDPLNRRYRYPFINCTNCGPRFTIIEDIPYDRAKTTMRRFMMCADCRAEYENPLDRRFHAEPIACSSCGPRVWLTDATGGETMRDQKDDAIEQTRALLSRGKIFAIKGIGGFHLVCDALNADAVEHLRQRKFREEKPFALMAGSVDLVRKYCIVSKAEEKLLKSGQRPIVLLERRTDVELADAVAPRVNTLGFMLPYAPLHTLLLENWERPLVFTSANVASEPICYENEDALRRLRNIAEYFLLHDRRIGVRSDDSVARLFEGHEMVLRRSRGHAPAPLKIATNFDQQILACGAELKNTFCLTRENYAFLSHHIGDLENLETLQSFTEGIEHFKRLFYLQPTVVAYDLHPEYISTKYARALEDFVKVGVQHHHAHIASCMADNCIDGDVIGVAMDGLGFGADGRLWGGEFFVANFVEAERVAHLDYIPMPGGAKAILEPWRMAATYLHRALGAEFLNLDLPFVNQLNRASWATVRSMIASGTNSPQTSSMGRLFDAVSSLIGLRWNVSYEGQAAIELETIADPNASEGYEFAMSAQGSVISAEPVIRGVVADLLANVTPPAISAKFHLGVAQMIASVARRVRNERQLNRVVLSGGVFQNMLLLRESCRILRSNGFEVLTHRRVPPNDGGISFGQAVVANARLAARRI